MSLDEPGFVGFEILLGVHVIRVLLDLVRLGLLTVVHTLLEVVLDDIHLRDDSLETNKLVGQFAAQTPRRDEVSAEIALEANPIVLYFGLELGPLIAEESSFEMIFAQSIVNVGIFDEVLSSLRRLLPQLVDVDLQGMRICRRDSRNEVVELALAVL